MLADSILEEKEEAVLDELMLLIAVTTLARTQGVEANSVIEWLALSAEQMLRRMSPEMIENFIAIMDAEKTSRSESKCTQAKAHVAQKNDYP